MPNLNKCFLIGNLTRDPELKYIPSGQAVASFSIAINSSYKAKDGTKKDNVTFIKIVAWARLAEICNEYLTKGSSVFVEGHIQTRSWDGADGEKRYATEVVAENIQFLNSKKKEPAAGDPSMDVDDSIFEAPEKPVDAKTKAKLDRHGLKPSDLKPDEDIPF